VVVVVVDVEVLVVLVEVVVVVVEVLVVEVVVEVVVVVVVVVLVVVVVDVVVVVAVEFGSNGSSRISKQEQTTVSFVKFLAKDMLVVSNSAVNWHAGSFETFVSFLQSGVFQ